LSRSQLVNFGADAFIVCTHRKVHSITKIAHPRDDAEQRLAQEYRLMTQMRLLGTPTPDIDLSPVTVNGRVVA